MPWPLRLVGGLGGRAEWYIWCATTKNTWRDYVRAVTFRSGLRPALLLCCSEDQSDIGSDRPPRSAPLGPAPMPRRSISTKVYHGGLAMYDARPERAAQLLIWQCIIINAWWMSSAGMSSIHSASSLSHSAGEGEKVLNAHFESDF